MRFYLPPVPHAPVIETPWEGGQRSHSQTCTPPRFFCGIADGLLTFSSGLVIFIGSYSFLKCLRKRAKSAAKLGSKAREWRLKSKRNKLAQVHPLGEVSAVGVVDTDDRGGKAKRNKLVQVHPLGEGNAAGVINTDDQGGKAVAPTNDEMKLQSLHEGKQRTTALTRDQAATKLQSMYRRKKARKRIRWMIANIFEKVVDERSGAFYYFNKRTGVSSWAKPVLMKENDDLEMTPRSKALAAQITKATEKSSASSGTIIL